MVKLHSPLDQVDTTYPLYGIGSRTVDKNGNEYIYLPGTTSVAAYDFVTYKTASGLSYGSVTRMVKGTAGQVAIAQGAATGPKYGWFQIYGVGWGNCGAVTSSGSPLYASGTTATVTTTVASTQLIYGTLCVGSGISGGTAKIFLNYPFFPTQTL